MYQTFILGMGALLLLALGFFITKSDRESIISFPAEASSSAQTVTREEVAGTYVCDSDSKCRNPRILILSSDGLFKMATSYADGLETLEERGTWLIDPQNMVKIVITESNSSTFVQPISLELKKVSKISLIGMPPAVTSYADWINPIFRKQEAEERERGNAD